MVRIALFALAGLSLLVLLDRSIPPNFARFHEQSAVLLAADGQILHVATTRDGLWRLECEPKDVDSHYIEILLAAEDRRFRSHWGIDLPALARAAIQLVVNGRIVSGGSTITMQVARLLEPHGRSVLGKLHDIIRAIQIEERFDKDEILRMYLTLAPFGGNIEGVRAASLAWFGHEPKHLSPGEAATLAVLPQRPAALRPDRHGTRAQAAAEHLLIRLAKDGAIPQIDLETPPPAVSKRHLFPRHAPQVAARIAASPGTLTTLDFNLQQEAENLATRATAAMPDGGEVALIVVDNRERAIRAWVGASRSTLDIARRRRSPGSTLKPFIYGLAFDDLAVLPETFIEDRPTRFGNYAPENFDRGFHGEVTAADALQQSLNEPAIALLDRVGPGRLAAVLRGAGAKLDFPRNDDAPSLPLALGGVGISLLDLTRLYVALARDGAAAPLRLREDEHGNGEAAPLMTSHAARLVTKILRGSPPPDGRVSSSVAENARPIAFKTGTSYGFRDALAVGYSPSWTVAVWVGRSDGTPRPGAFGRNTAAPILFSLFDLLPAETVPDGLAAGVVQESSAPIAPTPAGLRSFAERGSPPEIPSAAAPRILFPPNGAMIDLATEGDGLRDLSLEAAGGHPPYHWSVNGTPVSPSEFGAVPHWHPDGPGFARVTVRDGVGRRASVTVRIAFPGAADSTPE